MRETSGFSMKTLSFNQYFALFCAIFIIIFRFHYQSFEFKNLPDSELTLADNSVPQICFSHQTSYDHYWSLAKPLLSNSIIPHKATFKHLAFPDKYLVSGLGFGRHNNQIISLLLLFQSAVESGRKLVLPPFLQDNTIYYFHQLYNISFLKQHIELISEDQFRSLFPNYRNDSVQWPCLYETNLAFHHLKEPNNTLVGQLSCSNPQTIPRNAYSDLLNVLRQDHPVVFLRVPWGFAAHQFSRKSTRFLFLLRLEDQLLNEVISFKNSYLPHQYIAVHHRWRENLCLKQICGASKFKTLCPLYQELCYMNSEFLNSFLIHNGLDLFGLFLATDSQYRLTDDDMIERGAITYQGKYPSNKLKGAIIDMWLLVHGDIFIGNPLSSFSIIVSLFRQIHETGPSYLHWQPIDAIDTN